MYIYIYIYIGLPPGRSHLQRRPWRSGGEAPPDGKLLSLVFLTVCVI